MGGLLNWLSLFFRIWGNISKVLFILYFIVIVLFSLFATYCLCSQSQLCCTLWAGFAETMDEFLSNHDDSQPAVVILQMCKLKKYYDLFVCLIILFVFAFVFMNSLFPFIILRFCLFLQLLWEFPMLILVPNYIWMIIWLILFCIRKGLIFL